MALTHVRTYIASGNVLVNTTLSAKDIEKQTYDLIKKYIGPDLVVIVSSGAQLQKILDENPFQSGYDISRVFFVAFATKPSKLTIQKITPLLLKGVMQPLKGVTFPSFITPFISLRRKGFIAKRCNIGALRYNGCVFCVTNNGGQYV